MRFANMRSVPTFASVGHGNAGMSSACGSKEALGGAEHGGRVQKQNEEWNLLLRRQPDRSLLPSIAHVGDSNINSTR